MFLRRGHSGWRQQEINGEVACRDTPRNKPILPLMRKVIHRQAPARKQPEGIIGSAMQRPKYR